MKVLEIDELRRQMRIDFDDEDELLEMYGCAAEDVVIGCTERSYSELLEIGYREQEGATAKIPEHLYSSNFPARLKVAALMLAAHYYRNREPVASIAQNIVPYAIEQLIKPYVKLSERKG